MSASTVILIFAIAIPNAVSLGLIAALWLRMDRIERRAALEILGRMFLWALNRPVPYGGGKS